MRIAVLWPRLSGYFDACLRALLEDGHELFTAYEVPESTAPFEHAAFAVGPDPYPWSGQPDAAVLRDRLAAFRPDVVLVSSWHIAGYRRQLRAWRGRAVRVLCMDNQWRGAPKQWLGRATARAYLAPLYDCAFVPGDRQAGYARMLGFPDARIWRGLYSADVPAFDVGPRTSVPERRFLYVGRLVPDKAVDVLATAYRLHTATADRPWPLHVYGTGPQRHLLEDVPGVELHGFVQPADLPRTMRAAACLLLPSRFEPWGVVVHEAAAAGMVLVCSTRVGAAVHLLQDRWNGHLVPPDDPERLAAAMSEVSDLSDDELVRTGEASRVLAAQLSPQGWSAHLVQRTQALRRELVGAP